MAASLAALRKIWYALGGIDKRQLQFEIDMHRLFLLTSFNKMEAPNEKCLEEMTEHGVRLSFDEHQRVVQNNVHQQVAQICAAMDNILLEEPRDKKPGNGTDVERTIKRPSGLSFAVGQEILKLEQPEIQVPVKTRHLTLSAVSAALAKSIGYTLELKASQIDHDQAGQGVYLSGKAQPGTVVSFYPGIIYSPSQYRYMPGYPRMDITNSYLVSRYDGLIIDGQVWGCGGESRELWDGSSQIGEPVEVQTDIGSQAQAYQPKVRPNSLETKKRSGGIWTALFGTKVANGAKKGVILERRNPLALAHFVNHPTQGKQPNVMLCPYDLVTSDPYIRPYIPNVHFDVDGDEKMERRGLLWVHDRNGENSADVNSKVPRKSDVVRTLVLIATREIYDEEIFLNYRLSNHKNWPTWYQPVDTEEDKRRWN